MSGALRAFAGFGVELEYMIVDRQSLSVRPIADRLLCDASGAVVNELERGAMGWSNELTLHLVEIKNRQPKPALEALPHAFQREVVELNCRLREFDACLMPGGMHPWMDPALETRLWPHEHDEIYQAYDRIFGCHRHGFANLQSMHLNLPFADDAEFARLHAAVRMVLPLLPALAASSPVAEGHLTGFMDSRMEVYRSHQNHVPETMGLVIPVSVSSRAEYEADILAPMYRAIAPLDPEGTLGHEWLNARGAVPRFDRMALEIRVIDTQEHPKADLAVAAATLAVVYRLYQGEVSDLAAQQAFPEERLAPLLQACIRDADQAVITDPAYLGLLGLPTARCTAGELWHQLITAWWAREPEQRTAWGEMLGIILEHGPLARRIVRAVGPDCVRPRMERVYRALCDCLDADSAFVE